MATRMRARKAHRTSSGASKWKTRLLDFGIVAATALVCVFVFSFSTRLSYSGSETREPPVVVRAQILNGCGRAGLAGRVSDRMAQMQVGRMRFDIVDVGNYDRTTVRETLVINRHLAPDQVRALMADLNIGTFEIEDATTRANDLGVDLTIVLGSNSVEPVVSTEDPSATE